MYSIKILTLKTNPKPNMKQILFCLALFISANCLAQNNKNVLNDSIPTIDGRYEYQEIVNLNPEFTQEALYRNAKIYFVESYKSAKDVIQYDEKAEGKIIGKGFFAVSDVWDAFIAATTYNWDVNYTTEITCKNGKYRYRFYNIIIKQKTSGQYGGVYDIGIDDALKATKKGATKKLYIRLLNKMMQGFRDNQTQLKAYMIKQQGTASKDDF